MWLYKSLIFCKNTDSDASFKVNNIQDTPAGETLVQGQIIRNILSSGLFMVQLLFTGIIPPTSFIMPFLIHKQTYIWLLFSFSLSHFLSLYLTLNRSQSYFFWVYFFQILFEIFYFMF